MTLKRAIQYCEKTKRNVADHSGISTRTLQRYLNGTRECPRPIVQKILSACHAIAPTSVLSAELGYDRFIGTSAQRYLDTLIPLLLQNLALIEDEHPSSVEERQAAGDAVAILARWQQVRTRRQNFLDQQYLQSGDDFK